VPPASPAPQALPVPVGSVAASPAQQQGASCLVNITYGVLNGSTFSADGVFGAFFIQPEQVGGRKLPVTGA
jgi:hypothetical protein